MGSEMCIRDRDLLEFGIPNTWQKAMLLQDFDPQVHTVNDFVQFCERLETMVNRIPTIMLSVKDLVEILLRIIIPRRIPLLICDSREDFSSFSIVSNFSQNCTKSLTVCTCGSKSCSNMAFCHVLGIPNSNKTSISSSGSLVPS